MDRLVRLACSPDPEEPPTRPRRAALAPRAAVVAGTLLMVLAAVLVLRTVLGAPEAGEEAPGAARALGTREPSSPQAPATAPATLPQGAPPTDPRATSSTGASAQPGQAGSSQATGQVVVHVTGAVASPGVVVLGQGARVADAIEAAGGVTQEADADQLNLARVLSDGEQVRVPREGEVLTDQEAGAGQVGEQSGQSGSGAAQDGHGQEVSGLVNINTASALELEELPGIGPALAQRIVEHREANGPFGSVDELTEVSGIGQAKLEALREVAVV